MPVYQYHIEFGDGVTYDRVPVADRTFYDLQDAISFCDTLNDVLPDDGSDLHYVVVRIDLGTKDRFIAHVPY